MLAAASALANNKVSRKSVVHSNKFIYHPPPPPLAFFSFSLTHIQFVVPSSLRVLSSQPISQTNQNLIVELTDILGRSVGPFDVRVRSITDSEGTETKRDKAMSPGDDK